MPFERLFTDCVTIQIKWGAPCLLSDIRNNKSCKNQNCLYKIVGEYNGSFKLFYIGKSAARSVWRRLLDADHKLKQASIQDSHKHHKIYVSVGVIAPEMTRTELGEIENLLIYAHGGNPDFKRFINKKNIHGHNVSTSYTIKNMGFKQDGMYREVGVGMYFRK